MQQTLEYAEILADQTKSNDFKPFGTAMTNITNRTVDKAFEIYLALYQVIRIGLDNTTH